MAYLQHLLLGFCFNTCWHLATNSSKDLVRILGDEQSNSKHAGEDDDGDDSIIVRKINEVGGKNYLLAQNLKKFVKSQDY